MKRIIMGWLILSSLSVSAQTLSTVPSDYWQQRVKYTMDVDVNVATNKFTGKQKAEYWNNSPDTLTKIFYHLYWNAFQPNSMMDQRSRRQGTITADGKADWDPRVKDRILNLKPDEIGYQRVSTLKVNGKLQKFETQETILEVKLDKPILPRSKVLLEMEFEAQVPIQIRRSGRDNAEGVKYSMSQWYPKICEYDRDGWHPTPYIGREFYGVWGDYDVKISIDKSYIIGATGYLQNPNQVGYGYEKPGATVTRPVGNKLVWHFVAPNVHDFVWAADPEYIHLSKEMRNGLVFHVFYKISPELLKKQFANMSEKSKAEYKNNPDQYVAYYKWEWERLLEMAYVMLPFIEKTFGPYAYNAYSFIQGGDGGMEYPMATLLKGAGPDLVIHEFMHSWYQGMLGTNESLYPWMDEGFATFAEARVLASLNLFEDNSRPHADTYTSYYRLVKSGKEEPQTTHADHYNTNYAYKIASYVKGAIFLEQLGYITGAPVRDKILLDYYRQWRFKHPAASDFLKIAEKASGLKLDWYKEYWVNTTKTIDYEIDSLWEEGGKTKIRMSNQGMMPMPIDLQLTFKDGSKELHYVPMNLMYGAKSAEDSLTRKVYAAWRWTQPTYIIETNRKLTDLVTAEIDPSQRMADVERKNNKLELKW
ncbi:MAG TPA: M1 family metallopeptidase [Chitinophagaceae bacterium]